MSNTESVAERDERVKTEALIERLIAYTNMQYGWECTPDDLRKYREEEAGAHVLVLDRGIKGVPKVHVREADIPEHIEKPIVAQADGADVSLGGLFKTPGSDDLEVEVDLIDDFTEAGLSEVQNEALHEAGFGTFYDLDGASAKTITEVGGIGKGALTKIRDHCRNMD